MKILRNKPKCYVLIGLPGSGKSTWCKNNYPNLPIVSRDIIRSELGYTKDPDKKRVLSRAQEEIITNKENELIKQLAREKKDFIIDDTNIKREYRLRLIKLLRELGVYIVAVYFKTPLNVCIQRRSDQIDPEIMKRLGKAITKPEPQEYDKLIEVK